MKAEEKIYRNSETSEKSLERHLVESVKRLGGLALKYSNPYETGYPDRIIMLPGGHVFWVELKSKGETPSTLQRLRMESLQNIGQEVYWVDNRDTLNKLIEYFRLKS